MANAMRRSSSCASASASRISRTCRSLSARQPSTSHVAAVAAAGEPHRIAHRLGGRGQDQQPGVGGQQLQAPDIALLNLAGHRLAAGQPEPTGQCGGVPGLRQLEEGQGVAVALADDLVTHRSIQRPMHIAEQQRPGITVP
jgi:hypothetical protein